MAFNLALKTVVGCVLLFLSISTSALAADPYVQRCGDNITFIDSLYNSILNREPGEAERRDMLTALEGHKNREKMIAAFFDSKEYENLKTDNRGFVVDLFHGILGREPEEGELNERVAALVEGKQRWIMVRGMIGSSEYKKKIKKCP